MRKYTVVTTIICLMAIAASACQPTPESGIVVGKDAEVFESLLSETEERREGEDAREAVNDGKGENTKTKDEFSTDNGKITVKIDAKISSLSGKKPVYKIKAKTITPEDVKTWTDYFYGDHKVYENRLELSKEDISKKVLELKSRLNSDEFYAEYGSDEEGWKYITEDYQNTITAYEDMYDKAPEKTHREETDWNFKPFSFYLDPGTEVSELDDKTMYLWVVSDADDFKSNISGATRDAEDFRLNNISYINSEVMAGGKENLTTQDEAKEIVADAIKGLKLYGWEIDSCVSRHNGKDNVDVWDITCCRYYDDIPLIVLPQIGLIKGEGEYAAHYYYEELLFSVYNNQITLAKWQSPMEVSSVENEDAKILSLDEAMERFKDQISVMYVADTENQVIRVRRIDQNLVRVKIPNNDKEFYLIPSWSFYGYATGIPNEAEVGLAEGPLICINGVDGSVINTQMGY